MYYVYFTPFLAPALACGTSQVLSTWLSDSQHVPLLLWTLSYKNKKIALDTDQLP